VLEAGEATVTSTLTSTPAKLIEVRGLRKLFRVKGGFLGMRTRGYIHAVDGVSFSIAPGETLALVGESGCGKTTTAKLILRLLEPTEGEVELEGREVFGLEGADRKWYRLNVQAVFQDPWASLNPRMRVVDIVSEALVVNNKGLGKKQVRDAVNAVLERVGLQRGRDADLYPHEFSGGQRQRIAVASALVTQPRLIVLDEPVSALDVSVQAQVLNLLKGLQEQLGTAYLLITHDLATVRYVAHRVCVMYLGEIVEEARVEELFEQPKHPYTQALFASALPDHPRDRKDHALLEGEVPSPLNPPAGCRFAPRCPFAMEICKVAPEYRELSSGHWAACHLYDGDQKPSVG
jgi:oligopeptide/dipeptide ABC transporter ATP-binding protein